MGFVFFFLSLTLVMILLYKLVSVVNEIYFSGSKKTKKSEKIAKILDLVERDWVSTKNTSINKNMRLDPLYWYMKARKEFYYYDSEYGFCDKYTYSFENGYKLYYYVGDDRCRIVLLDRSTNKISEIDVKNTKDVAVDFLDKIDNIRYFCQDLYLRIAEQRKYHEYREDYNRNQRAYSGFTQSSQPKNDEYSGLDPKKADKLRKLDEKIKLRQEQINKMSKGSDRESLVNELDNYKRARERMMKV
jgi:hypothetical protein